MRTKIKLTRMHSSRMRNARLLTVSQHALLRGGVCLGCLAKGGVCPGVCVYVCVCVPGDVFPGGLSAQGVCGQNDRHV